MSSKINILHISDLHFTEPTGEYVKSRLIIDEFIAVIENILKKDKDWTPNYIVVSGDIAFKNNQKGYDIAETLFNNLLQIFPKDAKPNFIFCPGNHDKKLDKHEQGYLEEKDNKTIQSNYDHLEKVFIKDYNASYKSFEQYNKLRAKFPDEFLYTYPPDNGFLSGIHKFDNLYFVVINTAWICLGGSTDYGRLIICKEIIENLRQKINEIKNDDKNAFVITVMHHPPYWLKYSEYHQAKNESPSFKMLSSFSDLILSGHDHSMRSHFDSIYNNTHFYSTGAFFEKDDSILRNFSIIQLDTEQSILNKLLFKWDTTGKKDKWSYNKDEITHVNINRNGISYFDILEQNKLLKNDIKKLSKSILNYENELFKFKQIKLPEPISDILPINLSDNIHSEKFIFEVISNTFSEFNLNLEKEESQVNLWYSDNSLFLTGSEIDNFTNNILEFKNAIFDNLTKKNNNFILYVVLYSENKMLLKNNYHNEFFAKEIISKQIFFHKVLIKQK